MVPQIGLIGIILEIVRSTTALDGGIIIQPFYIK